MPAAVAISAAVAAQHNERAGVLAPIVVGPFKRQWRRWTRDRGAEQTRAESAEGSADGGAHDRRRGAEEIGEHRETGDAAWRGPDPPAPAPSEPLPAARGVYQSPVDMRADADAYEEELYLLTSAPYRTLVRQFALVPAGALLAAAALLLLVHGAWAPFPPFASSLGLFVVAAAGWVVAYALRTPIYLLASYACRLAPSLTPSVSTLVQVLCEEALRLSVLVLLRLRLHGSVRPADPVFPRLWAIAMGWAAAEVVVSVWQGYEQLALYKDVLAPAQDAAPSPLRAAQPWLQDAGGEASAPRTRHVFEDPESYMQAEIEQLLRVRARLELEVLYGVPVPNIPVFISCLQRIDSIILSLALFLNLSASYLANVARQGVLHHTDRARAVRDTLPTFFFVVAFHAFLSLTWSASVLPRIGVHSASYTGVVLALGALFVGLGRWDAL